MSLVEKEKQAFLTLLLRNAVFLAFAFFTLLSFIWIGIKIRLAYHLSPELSFLALIDIIRSHLSLDLAISILLLLSCKKTASTAIRTAAILLFFIVTFYFLKLTGLYAYTYDATPWQMIEYGSYLLQVPFASKALSFFAYIFLPLFLILMITFEYLRKKEQSKKEQKTLRIWLLSAFILLILACIPPLQKDFLYSLSYHPYIYSVSGAFTKQEKENLTNKTELINNVSVKPETQSLEGINLVIVILESFSESTIRPDVTPTLSELKSSSLNFSHAYSNIPHTSKALVNIFCNEAYFSPYLFESIYGTKESCLADNINHQNVFFQGITKTFENREALVKTMGFDDFYSLESLNQQGFEAVNYFSYEDDIVLPASLKWINSHKTDMPVKNFLSVYLTGITHHNYQTPSDFIKSDYSNQKNFNDYLNAAHYVDQFISKLFAQYQQAGLMENTFFIFVGDHGEGFNDKQALMHNNNVFQTGLHIPLFIYNPSLIEPDTIDTPFGQNQIKQLLLSYSPEKQAFTYNFDRQEAVVSSCWYMHYCYAITRQVGDNIYKLIDDKRNKRSLLYNLSSDPKETLDLIDNHPELARQLQKELNMEINENLKLYNGFFSEQDPLFESKKASSFSVFKSVTKI